MSTSSEVCGLREMRGVDFFERKENVRPIYCAIFFGGEEV
jgi:hypothetical protein